MKLRSFRIPFGVEMQHGFACKHCGSRRPLFRSPVTAGRHVRQCIRNPGVRACATCEHDHPAGSADGCALGLREASVVIVRQCAGWSRGTR